MNGNYIVESIVNNHNFVFRITERNNEWRIYVLKFPMRNRGVSGHDCHLVQDQFDRYYICWTKLIQSFDSALTISNMWARRYLKYRYTGQTF